MAPHTMYSLSHLISLATFISSSFSAFHYPDALTSRLEHLLVDTDGSFRSGFKDAITPCSNYVNGLPTWKRQTSAQWIRVAFHDAVTAHVEEGTGGLDASISMETLRPEDTGTAFNETFGFFVPFINARTSAADLLATGVVLSLGNCGGLHVPLRAGRIDAHEPGPFGVPEPESSLEETLEDFAVSGFNAKDAIGLTACGHALGRVHANGFPQVVPESVVTPDNLAGGIDLDTTPEKFDMNVVTEYLEGTGQRGGPLVTTDNVTVRSDLRLYESDGNTTMKELGQSEEYFATTCKGLFERMINTVPKEVELSDVIEPIPVKPINVTFDVADGEEVVLRGVMRVLTQSGALAPEAIQLSLSDSADITASALVDTGYSVWGNTTFYPFNFTLYTIERDPANTLNLSVKASDSMPGANFTLDPTIFFVPSMSTIDGDTFNVGIAFLGSSTSNATTPEIKARISYPVEQPGMNTLVPAIKTATVQSAFSQKSRKGFELWKATWTAPGPVNWTAVSVDIEGKVGKKQIVDEYSVALDLL